MTTVSEDLRMVCVVKEIVTDPVVNPGMRSVKAMAILTPVTWPPMFPDGTPALWRSVEVETETPVGFPVVGAPIVKPVIVTVYAPG